VCRVTVYEIAKDPLLAFLAQSNCFKCNIIRLRYVVRAAFRRPFCRWIGIQFPVFLCCPASWRSNGNTCNFRATPALRGTKSRSRITSRVRSVGLFMTGHAYLSRDHPDPATKAGLSLTVRANKRSKIASDSPKRHAASRSLIRL